MIGFELVEGCTAQKTAVVVLDVASFAGPAVGYLLQSLGCDAAASESAGVNKVSELNDAVLRSAGLSASDWTPFNTRWLASPKASQFLNEALELLQSEFGGSYISLIQDKHTARILPFWNIVFERSGLLARYLLTVDDPAETVRVLYNSLGVEESIGQLIWLRVALDGELYSRGRFRAFVGIRQLNADPIVTFNSVARTINLTFPRDPQTALGSEEFGSELVPKLLRPRKEQPGKISAAADWVAAVHQVFMDWASNGESIEGQTVLDAVREAFDEAVPVFFKLGQSVAAKSLKLRELEQELESLRAGSQSAEESAKEIQSVLKARISHLESELAQRRAEIDETEEALRSARLEVGTLNEKLENLRNSTRKEADGLRKANAEAEEQLRARYSEIVTLTRMLSTETLAARKFERNAERLGSIAQAFERGLGSGRLGKWLNSMLPWRWQFKRIRRHIERQGLFDSSAYLGANPDVASAGVNPLRHYLTHGATEGRPLGIE